MRTAKVVTSSVKVPVKTLIWSPEKERAPKLDNWADAEGWSTLTAATYGNPIFGKRKNNKKSDRTA